MIEVLVAFSILMMLIVTVVPISVQIKKEQQKLSDRITVVATLYDELQQVIWHNSELTQTFTRPYKNRQLTFRFRPVNDLLQGCVEWTNVNFEKEKSCLYGYVS